MYHDVTAAAIAVNVRLSQAVAGWLHKEHLDDWLLPSIKPEKGTESNDAIPS